MKIACIGAGWYPQTPGGLEKYVYGMAREVVRSGDELDLFVTGEPRSWDPRVRVASLARTADSLPKRLASARRAFARTFRPPYDVVNIHFAMNALPLLPFIRRDARRVVHFHGPWAAESREEGGNRIMCAIKERLERYVYRRADRFITLSTAFKEILTATYGVDPGRVRVIPMGIDTSFFVPPEDKAAVRARLGWPLDKRIFFTARRLVNRVGCVELLEAIATLRTTHDGFVVKIAGRGPLAAELAERIRALGLTEYVELLGFVTEERLVEAYQAADVTVLPTQSLEGFGTIISESLACGTPVVVTPVGGMPEAIAPLDPRLICESPAPAAIAQRLAAILDGTLTPPDAAACRRFALERYDWSAVWMQIREAFVDERRY
jgi:glycosyltransferase involved in cell wall biosynthesis